MTATDPLNPTATDLLDPEAHLGRARSHTSAGTQDAEIARRVDALFGDAAGTTTRRRRRRRRTRTAMVAGVATAALVASAVWAGAASGSSNGNYRTAAASIQDVTQQLSGVATIEPVSQASVAFPTGGTVATVDVALGDAVTVGQQLATLDTEALTQTLHERQATLAAAELDLSKELDGEAVDTSGTSGSGSSPGKVSNVVSTTGAVTAIRVAATQTTGASSGSSPFVDTASPSATTTTPTTSSSTAASSTAALVATRQAVVDAQAAVDVALRASDTALDAATTVCASVGSTSSTATASSSSTTTTTSVPGGLQACVTAITDVQRAQQKVADAQTQLSAATNALDELLASQPGSKATPSSGAGAGASQSGATNPASGTRSEAAGSSTPSAAGSSRSNGSNGTASTASSQDLIAAQKAVDAAQLQVTVAEQAIAQASIASPIAGTVVAVGLAVGESATAGSSTQHIVVQGSSGFEAVTAVTVDQIGHVRVGQDATVAPDGHDELLRGKVVAIAQTPESSSSTTSYRVTIGLNDPSVELGNGSTGTVTIVTDGATAALAVPTSAVSTDGDQSTVTVYDGSGTHKVRVTVGAIGTQWTQINSGIERGQKVVLADLDKALPSAATSATSNSTNGSAPGATGEFPGGFADRSGGPPSGTGGPPN